MKVIILGGLSGAGKTTVLLRLAEYLKDSEGKRGHTALAVVENEIGAADIDAKRLADRGDPVESLLAGCGLSEELAACVRKMQRKENPDWLVVEAAGLGIPWKIKENLEGQGGQDIMIWTVADASRWLILNDSLSRLAAEQLYGADVVFVNKCDQVSQDLQRRVEISVAAKSGGAVSIPVNALKTIKGECVETDIEKDVKNG